MPVNKIEALVKTYKETKSFSQTAKIHGLSRQRVHQIITGYKSPSHKPLLGGLDYIREEVRERDNFTCQLCMNQWIPGERRFDVHHLDERMESVKNYEYDKANQDKLLTLCHRCHLRLSYIVKRTFDVMDIDVDKLPLTSKTSTNQSS